MKILNTWKSEKAKKEYCEHGSIIYAYGDCKIYKLCHGNFLYTVNDIAVNNLAGLNKDHLHRIADRNRPKGAYTSQHFLYDRAMEALEKGLFMNGCK